MTSSSRSSSSTSTFIQREEQRWLTWYNTKARAMIYATARRCSVAAGSVSAWINPVRTAQPGDSYREFSHLQAQLQTQNAVMAARCSQARTVQRDASFTDLELAQFILEQGQDQQEDLWPDSVALELCPCDDLFEGQGD